MRSLSLVLAAFVVLISTGSGVLAEIKTKAVTYKDGDVVL